LLPMLAGVVLAAAGLKFLLRSEKSDRESLAIVWGALLTNEINGVLEMRTGQRGDRIAYGVAALCSMVLIGLLLRHLGRRERKSLAQQAVPASRTRTLGSNTRAASASKPFRVLIIGGGVAGPALALFLKRAGVSSSVFEAYPFREGVGGGLGLAPNGMKVLQSLGVAEEVKRQGTVIRRFAFNNGSGRKLTSYELNHDRYGEPMVALDRATLFELLAVEMSRKGIDVHYGKRLTHVQEMPSSIVAHFEDGNSVEGDLIIGADGVRSTVRNYVVPQSEAEYTGLVGVGGFTSLSSLPSLASQMLDTMTFTFGKNGFVGYSGCHQGTMMWWSNLFREREYSGEELSQLNPSAIVDEMLARFGEYADPIPSLIQHSTNLLRVNVYDILSLPNWHRGRTLLIGDAAHTVSPNAGQGASMALEDAIYLAKLLRNSQDPLVFRSFELARKERAERIVAEGRRRGKDKAVVGPIEQTIREWMIRTIGFFGKNADDWIHRYTINWG
jgi:2-polyprenyl-6-methoxyphenol hydroxylase-like FAD-dependent oxidoreductase